MQSMTTRKKMKMVNLDEKKTIRQKKKRDFKQMLKMQTETNILASRSKVI